jgi:hypothetical protein
MTRTTPALLGIWLAGCSVTARSADRYRDDTTVLLETKRSAITACYDSALRTMAGSQGTVTVRFKVAEDSGRLHDLALDAARTTAPPAVSICVMRELEDLALSPADAREGQATYTWEFTAPPAPAGPT